MLSGASAYLHTGACAWGVWDWRVGLERRAPSSNKDAVAPDVPALTVKPTLPGQ